MVRDFHRVMGIEARKDILELEGRLPDSIIACVGGGSNAIGIFHAFLNDKDVKLIGVEAGGRSAVAGNGLAHRGIALGRADARPVLAVNVDDSKGADGNARQAFIGQNFIPAGYALGKKMSELFPKDGPIKAVIGVSAPGQNWSEQRAAGVMKFLEEYKAANPTREVDIKRLDTGTDGAVVADRVGAYLNANPDTTVYFDTGLWHAYVAQALADRGVPPGKVLMGGFDIVAEVLQQMQAGYIQVEVDQQPYMQGFMSVMEAYLAKNFGLAPADIDTGRGIVVKADVSSLMDLAKQGVR